MQAGNLCFNKPSSGLKPLIFQDHCDSRIGDFQAEERGVYVSECISCMPVERTVYVWEGKLRKHPCIMLIQN